ncbi:MAG: hypothetical protein ABW321_11575 [Polyangiales bacterium]
MAGCSSSETLLALSVVMPQPITGLTTFDATITQSGQSPVVRSITPPTVPIDGGTKIRDRFFDRIPLPEAWTSAPAEIRVDAKGSNGATLATVTVSTEIEDDGVVAALVTFAPPPPPDAGTAPGDDAGI